MGIPFALPDYDVFAINANANPPVETDAISGVGTILFNMVVNPAKGKKLTNMRASGKDENVVCSPVKPRIDAPAVPGRAPPSSPLSKEASASFADFTGS